MRWSFRLPHGRPPGPCVEDDTRKGIELTGGHPHVLIWSIPRLRCIFNFTDVAPARAGLAFSHQPIPGVLPWSVKH